MTTIQILINVGLIFGVISVIASIIRLILLAKKHGVI